MVDQTVFKTQKVYETFEQSGAFVAPNGLLFDGIISDDHDDNDVNYLSNSQKREVATFKQINSYIHYVPNAAGGVGELDQTDFILIITLAGTPVTDKFYRYGKPT